MVDDLPPHFIHGQYPLIESPIKPIPKGWQPIKDAPTDDSVFLVGGWFGEKVWNEDYSGFVWVGKPTFKKTVSHRENPQGPHSTRGWNHRGGPFDGNATLWHPMPDDPEFTDSFVESLNKS